MKKIFLLLNIFLLLWTDGLLAQSMPYNYSIDNTCRSCDRRLLDSLNVYRRRPIRINQVGYRPQDAKSAFVANPTATTFRIMSAESGQEVFSGNLQSLGVQPRPGMWVNGAFNSITSVYEFGDTLASTQTENLYRATFSQLVAPGRYYMVLGNDTSAIFRIDETIYNKVFETALMFFGVNRCGNTHSHIHGPCHLLDGSGIGKPGALQGGWHDCGDHFKVSETIGYTALVLTMTYALFPERANDFYGRSYADTLPFGNDGIPDLLWEAKVGVDFIYRLYQASREDGLIAQADMYHSVGVNIADHQFWDRPEFQDAQPVNKGGAPRVVARGVGANVSGMYAASLAFFSWAWAPFDPAYADSLKNAAIDIYDNVVMRRLGAVTTGLEGFYTGGGRLDDDPAAAALALWFLTKDERYRFDLLENTSIHDNRVTSQYDNAFFAAGHMGNTSGFHHGGWTTDYQQVHAFVLYGLGKLILGSENIAAEYGINATRRQELLTRVITTLRKSIDNGSNGATRIPITGNYGLNVDLPYGGVFTSVDWGFNRYNLGMVNELFMMWDLTREQVFFDYGLANMDYNLGMNPWDISFVMGVGDKNLQHPHNRAANPDGYNAGGFPYAYTCPRGALMGGARPTRTLKDDWSDYTVTETCIDFSAQLVLPAMILSKELPPDFSGPGFSDVIIHQVTNTGAVVGWKTDELSVDTLLISRSPGGEVIARFPAGALSMEKGVVINGLSPNTPYFFMLVGMDIRRNHAKDDNNGQWYAFTTSTTITPPAQTTGVRVCNIRHNQATVFWWTPNGRYTSAVEYGPTTALGQRVDGDDSGLPGLFHSVTLRDLLPNTTYYFNVISGTTRDNNNGAHYQFTTTPVLADIDVLVKPMFDGRVKFFIDVTNNTTTTYQGLQLRYYFTGADAANYQPQIGYSQLRDGGGMTSQAQVSLGAIQAVPGGQYWYLPITINSTLAVSGAARIQIEMVGANWTAIPLAAFRDDWSVRAHTEPVATSGINLDRALLYQNSEFVEIINGAAEVTYTRTKYITAYYNGAHISGYPPDFQNNMPLSYRDVFLRFDSPFVSPSTFVEQDSMRALFSGRAWARPDARISHIEVDAVSIPFTPFGSRVDSVSFTREQMLQYGSNPSTWVAWHNRDGADCACAVVRANVEVDTLTVPRPLRRLVVEPDTAVAYAGKRVQVRVQLVDSAGMIRTGEDIAVQLRSSQLGITAWNTAIATMPITAITLINGEATFFVGSDIVQRGEIQLLPSNPLAEFQYIPGVLSVVIEELPPWPLINSARLLDTDCDVVPDLLEIELTQEFQDGQFPEQVVLQYRGDSLVLLANLFQLNGRQLRIPINLSRRERDAAPQGRARLQLNAMGQSQNHQEMVTDGVGPSVVSVSILEREDATQLLDTMYVQMDEAITSPGNLWFFAARDAQGNPVQAPVVVFAELSNPERHIWMLVLQSSTPGITQSITAGHQLQVLPENPLQDISGNRAAPCAQPWLEILLRRRPIAIADAYIADQSGDGLADFVRVEFRRSVPPDRVPDSLSIIFGVAPPETLMVQDLLWNTERTGAELVLPRPFRLGNTHGPYETVVEGITWRSCGLVIQHMGQGAQYESNQAFARDSVGPVVMEATYSGTSVMDSLRVVYSEPVIESGGNSGWILLRERGLQGFNGEVRNLDRLGQNMIFLYTQNTEGRIVEGDLIRLPPQNGVLLDASSNQPSLDNPWVVVRGRSAVNVGVQITMRSPVSRSSVQNTGEYGLLPPQNGEYFRLYVEDPVSGLLWLLDAEGNLLSPVDTNQVGHLGPTFLISLDIPRGSAFLEKPIWDSLSLNLQGMFYSNLGAFVNNSNYAMVLKDGRLLDREAKLRLRLEWLVHPEKGPLSQEGRAIGSGAYLARWEISGKMHLAFSQGVTSEQISRFNRSFSNSRIVSFGYIRE